MAHDLSLVRRSYSPVAFVASGTVALLISASLAMGQSALAGASYSTLWQFPLTTVEGDILPSSHSFVMADPSTAVFGAVVADPSGQRGLWSASAASTRRIARTWDPLPDQPLGYSSISNVGEVSRDGHVWFTGANAQGSRYYEWNGTSSSVVLATGQIAPGTGEALNTVWQTAVGVDGTAYIGGNVGGANTSTMWRRQGTTFQMISQEGQSVSGLPAPLRSASINRVLPDGRVAMYLTTGTTSGVAMLPSGNSTLASAGAIASLNTYGLLQVSPQGAMLLSKSTTGPGAGQSVWRRDLQGQLSEVLRPSGPVPGIAGWAVASQFVAASPQGWAVADDGRAIVTATMGPTGDLRATIALTSPTGVTPLLRTGLPLGSGTVSVGAGVAATDFNARGQVALQVYSLIGGTNWPSVVAWDPTLGLVTLAAPGDQLLVDGVLRTVTAATLPTALADQSGYLRGGLFDSGAIAMLVNFDSGPPAVITTIIPAPSAMIVSLLAIGVVARRRR